eukprot:COSAG06_NODE_10240_length_1721_cov_1.773736_1_plen_104_part_10
MLPADLLSGPIWSGPVSSTLTARCVAALRSGKRLSRAEDAAPAVRAAIPSTTTTTVVLYGACISSERSFAAVSAVRRWFYHKARKGIMAGDAHDWWADNAPSVY